MVFGFFEQQFAPSQLPDQTGKVILVTGGNTGIGYENILQLATLHARVYMGARNEERAMQAINKIKSVVKDADVLWLQMDLTDLTSVKQAAEQFITKEKRLDVLINNAGIMATPYALTPDGLETQFQTNHMGHYLLTRLLLPTLIATSKMDNTSVRIVNVSSMAQKMPASAHMTFESLETINKDQGVWDNYCQSKLANVLFTRGLDKFLKDEKIFANTLHPGVIDTQLIRGAAETYGRLMTWSYSVFKWMIMTPFKGGLTSLYCAASPEIEEKGWRGKWFEPVAKLSDPGKPAMNDAYVDNLWNISNSFLIEKGFLQK